MPVAEAPRSRSCSGCHAWISGTKHDPVEYERQHARFPYWERYVENVGSFLAVPDLAASGARLDESWVAAYLLDPYEVRPGLYERMMRVPVTESIAAFLRSQRKPLRGVAEAASQIPPSAAKADVDAGAALFANLSCGSCHAIGAIDREARGGAPDLAYTRARMAPADIAALIADPVAFGAGAGRLAMPTFDLTAVEAARLRDYVLSVAPAREAAAAVPADLPLLTRAVGWEEVSTKVFGKICVHCHMTAEKNDGEGGPGNTGGLGFAGKKLDLETWEALAKSSVLTPRNPGEEAPLVTRLRRRALEHAPALAPEDMQLVRSWLAQGAPGPGGRKAIAGGAPCRVPATTVASVGIDPRDLLDCSLPEDSPAVR
jgi:mono/diheme cytochrome c family protein